MDSHTYSRTFAAGGFAQKVGNTVHQVEMVVVVPVTFGTTSASVVLPKGAKVLSVSLQIGTAFTGGTSPTFKVGATANGAEYLAAQGLTGASYVALAPASPGQTVYVTIAGGPTAGAGNVIVRFVNS